MKTINLKDVNNLLIAKGIKSEFVMSGGGCGTIYLGEYDSQGYADFAVGPCDFINGETSWEDLNWGVDGSDFATYAHKIISEEEFNAETIASCVAFAYYNRIGAN